MADRPQQVESPSTSPWPGSGLAGRIAQAIGRHPAWTIFLCALVVRFAAVFALRGYVDDGGGDTVRYVSLAQDILKGQPYGTASGDSTRVPLYPIFVALHFSIFGTSLLWVSVTQAFLDAITAVMLGRLAVSLSGRLLGWGVGALWAVYPPAVLNAPLVFPYPLQIFWLTLAMLLMVTGLHRGSVVRMAAAGAFWGAACLTRAGYLLFVPIFAMLPLLGAWGSVRVSRVRRFAGFFAVIAAAAIAVGWWSARDFTHSYRLEYLFLNGHERRAVRLLLRPVEPVHERLAMALHARFGRAAPEAEPATGEPASAEPASGEPASAIPVPAIVLAPTPPPPGVDEATRDALVKTEIADLRWKYRRRWQKLWDALRAPDGCVQLQCTGPADGFWNYLHANFREAPLTTAASALGRPCSVLKVAMYLQHGTLLLLVIPALAWRLRRGDTFGVFATAFILYSLAGIVLATHYGSGLGAVPRYAFALMPLMVLLVGTWLIARASWLRAVPSPL